jgi:hypothetical protein
MGLKRCSPCWVVSGASFVAVSVRICSHDGIDFLGQALELIGACLLDHL